MGIGTDGGFNPLGNNDPNAMRMMMDYKKAQLPGAIGQGIQPGAGANASAGTNAGLAKIAAALMGRSAMNKFKQQYMPDPGGQRTQAPPPSPMQLNPTDPLRGNPALGGAMTQPSDVHPPMAMNAPPLGQPAPQMGGLPLGNASPGQIPPGLLQALQQQLGGSQANYGQQQRMMGGQGGLS